LWMTIIKGTPKPPNSKLKNLTILPKTNKSS
jgi:hypothetical protein